MNKDLTTGSVFKSIIYSKFKEYSELPKISKCSKLLQKVYDEVCNSDNEMCYVTNDDWKELFSNQFDRKDIEKLKEEVKKLWESLKKEHKKARHIPYAYILTNTAGKSDDKEPSGTSASPIYQVLERNNLTNKVIFVVRYFGGTKLGAGGLIRAYKTASTNVLSK